MFSSVRPFTHDRWIAVLGLVFVGLLIVAIAVGTAPEAEKSDETILDYYGDSGNQAKQIATALIATIALTAFLAFVTGLRLVLVEAGAPAPFPDLAFVGGLAFALIALVGIAIGTAVPATFVFSDTFELDADTARIVLTIGNIWLLSFAGATGSLLVGAVSFASRRTTLLPAWLEWAGLIASPLILVSLPLFGLATIAVVVWVLALSLVLLVRGRRERSAS
jgi:multisubunit Na+/H+ antiporter MnhB subunit